MGRHCCRLSKLHRFWRRGTLAMKIGRCHLLLALLLLGLAVQCFLYLRDRPSFNILHNSLPSVWQSPNTSTTEKYGNVTSTTFFTTEKVIDVINPHPFGYILNSPHACNPTTELIIGVVTAVQNFEDRAAVRETWGSFAAEPSHNTSLVFILGATTSPILQSQLENESRLFGDIVQEDFVDTYRNLTIKSVALLKWVITFCNSSKYVLKADDDMYVNVPNLLVALREQTKRHFVLGCVFVGARPRLDSKSKWYTPLKDFNEKVYPRYTSGTAYSMSTTAAALLYNASLHIKLFWLEDIYITGLCARQAGVDVLNHSGFSYIRQEMQCCYFRDAITAHQYTASEKRLIHQILYNSTQESLNTTLRTTKVG